MVITSSNCANKSVASDPRLQVQVRRCELTTSLLTHGYGYVRRGLDSWRLGFFADVVTRCEGKLSMYLLKLRIEFYYPPFEAVCFLLIIMMLEDFHLVNVFVKVLKNSYVLKYIYCTKLLS